MEKKRLRGLSQLTPTSDMMQIAEKDIPEKENTRDTYRCEVYIRSQVMDGILKAAFFLARDLRIGGTRPVYELFIDRNAGKFLTWDVIHAKWRTSVLMNLEWPNYITSVNTYIDSDENREMKQYLEVESDGYDGISVYQERLRENALNQKHKRRTESWDKVMAQVPPEPKDWSRWVDKHGIHQNNIF